MGQPQNRMVLCEARTQGGKSRRTQKGRWRFAPSARASLEEAGCFAGVR